MDNHWGTIQYDDENHMTAAEHKQLSKAHTLDIDGPMLHQPFSRTDSVKDKDNLSSQFTLHPSISHSIHLLQYIRTLRTLIQNGQQTMDSYKIDATAGAEPPILPEAPPMPVLAEKESVHKFVPFSAPQDTDFTKGQGEAPIEIDGIMCHQLLRKSIGVICTHLGYEVCSEAVLSELTDATKLFYEGLTGTLRQAINADAGTIGIQHQDCVEVMLNECGVGGVAGLHQFYNSRIINYQQHLISVAEQLIDEYNVLKSPEIDKEIKHKEEAVMDITFPNGVDMSMDDDNLGSSVSLDMNIEAVEMNQKRALQALAAEQT